MKPFYIYCSIVVVIIGFFALFAPSGKKETILDCYVVEVQKCISCNDYNYIYKIVTPTQDTVLSYSEKREYYDPEMKVSVSVYSEKSIFEELTDE